MSTPNFSYENRCVHITNEDYEMGNVPETANRSCNDNRYYPSYEVEATEYPQRKPIAHSIVITPGYYEDACLDYISNGFDIHNDINGCYRFDTIQEFIEEVQYFYPTISAYRIRKCLGKMGDQTREEYFYKGLDRIAEWVEETDAQLCEEIIDHLAESYGYRELVCTARFSNGEAMYDYKDNKRALLKSLAV